MSLMLVDTVKDVDVWLIININEKPFYIEGRYVRPLRRYLFNYEELS